MSTPIDTPDTRHPRAGVEVDQHRFGFFSGTFAPLQVWVLLAEPSDPRR